MSANLQNGRVRSTASYSSVLISAFASWASFWVPFGICLLLLPACNKPSHDREKLTGDWISEDGATTLVFTKNDKVVMSTPEQNVVFGMDVKEEGGVIKIHDDAEAHFVSNDELIVIYPGHEKSYLTGRFYRVTRSPQP